MNINFVKDQNLKLQASFSECSVVNATHLVLTFSVTICLTVIISLLFLRDQLHQAGERAPSSWGPETGHSCSGRHEAAGWRPAGALSARLPSFHSPRCLPQKQENQSVSVTLHSAEQARHQVSTWQLLIIKCSVPKWSRFFCPWRQQIRTNSILQHVCGWWGFTNGCSHSQSSETLSSLYTRAGFHIFSLSHFVCILENLNFSLFCRVHDEWQKKQTLNCKFVIQAAVIGLGFI